MYGTVSVRVAGADGKQVAQRKGGHGVVQSFGELVESCTVNAVAVFKSYGHDLVIFVDFNGAVISRIVAVINCSIAVARVNYVGYAVDHIGHECIVHGYGAGEHADIDIFYEVVDFGDLGSGNVLTRDAVDNPVYSAVFVNINISRALMLNAVLVGVSVCCGMRILLACDGLNIADMIAQICSYVLIGRGI